MGKLNWKPGNFIYPAPAVMVSCGENEDEANITTVSWTGNICTNPPMVYISLRPERLSYDIIKRTGEFVINIANENLTYETDYCGVVSGREGNKFKKLKLTPEKSIEINTFSIKECAVNIECRVKEIIKLGSHDMFISDVVLITVDEKYMDEKGKFNFNESMPIIYSHGEYRGIKKEKNGKFGFAIAKK